MGPRRQQLLQFLRTPRRVLMTPQLRRNLRVSVIAFALIMRVSIDHGQLALLERRLRAASTPRAGQKQQISFCPHRNEFHAIYHASVQPLLRPVRRRRRSRHRVRRRARSHTSARASRDRKSRRLFPAPSGPGFGSARFSRRPRRARRPVPIPPPRCVRLEADRTPDRKASRRRRLVPYSRTSSRNRATGRHRPPA